jgi:hypothetical protein
MGKSRDSKGGMSKPASSKPGQKQKRKRGRPPIYDREERKNIMLFRQRYRKALANEPDTTSERHKHNLVRQGRAHDVLKVDPEFDWLCGEDLLRPHKPSILVELGRIDDLEEMKRVARIVVKRKPKTKDAVALVRRMRLGGKSKGDVIPLSDALRKCLNQYRASHAIPGKEVLVAIEMLVDAFRAANK